MQLQAMQLVTDKDLMESVFALSVLKWSNGGATLTIYIECFAGNSLYNLHAFLTSCPHLDCILYTNAALI